MSRPEPLKLMHVTLPLKSSKVARGPAPLTLVNSLYKLNLSRVPRLKRLKLLHAISATRNLIEQLPEYGHTCDQQGEWDGTTLMMLSLLTPPLLGEHWPWPLKG